MIKAYWSPKIAEFLELKMHAIATLEALNRVYYSLLGNWNVFEIQ